MMCSMLPLFNDAQGDICPSENYRAIRFSTVLINIFESIILYHSYEALSTSNHQFGFKIKHSTIHCVDGQRNY